LTHQRGSGGRLSAMPAATSRNRANHWRGIANPASGVAATKAIACPKRFEGASQLGPGLALGLFSDPASRYPAARMTDADSAESAGEFSWPGRMAPPGAKQSRDPMQGERNKAADNAAECHLCNTIRETAPAGDE
jgi:hypothetical protein